MPLLFKANASTVTETGTSENSTATNTNGPSPNENSAEIGKALNGSGEFNGITLGNGIGEVHNDWSKSYHGLSSVAFSKDIADVLQAPVDPLDIEMKPGQSPSVSMLGVNYKYLDGLIYLPEIKYRRILNKAFGPGAWGLAPRSETRVDPKVVSREYALVCQGRHVRFLCCKRVC